MLSDVNFYLAAGLIVPVLYGAGRIAIAWLDRRQAMHEINVYVTMCNAVAGEAKEAGIQISQEDVNGMKEAFEEMCPTAVKLGMEITRFKVKD